jgi:hypothetical protein
MKVFCVGFQKTGTTSVGRALRAFGYRVRGNVGFNVVGKKFHIHGDVNRAKLLRMVSPLLDRYDAFEDNPWCFLYPELDEMYPKSKFILVLRDEQQWIQSVIRHFGSTQSPMNEFIYGKGRASSLNREHYLTTYRAHNEAVIEYFRSRPDNLLVMRLEELRWEPLCHFLDENVPNRPFPHANKTLDREKVGFRKIVNNIKRQIRSRF